jgi:glycosyltransferase involved in cell wall biosynthesis
MPGFLRAVDAVLVPSFAEGLPNVCVEASACGRGVLASAVGGIPDVILDGETGLILPAGDVRAWTGGLVASSRQYARLQEMGRRGRLRVQQFFDSRSYGTKLLALYQDALSVTSTGGVRP